MLEGKEKKILRGTLEFDGSCCFNMYLMKTGGIIVHIGNMFIPSALGAAFQIFHLFKKLSVLLPHSATKMSFPYGVAAGRGS